MGCKHVKVIPSLLDSSQFSDFGRKSEILTKIYQQRISNVISNVSIDLSPLDNEAFSPIVCQQRQTAIDNINYRETIDKWQPSSIEELVSFIQELCPNENQIDRAWIIFYWISQNIHYDTDGFFNNQIGIQNPDDVFQNRKAACEGYSLLYAELCTRTGIKCRTIKGYSKGFEFDVRQTKFDKTDHAWNIIMLNNNHLYFVEPTWGSGHVDSLTYEYKQELVPHYFLCRPEHMIYGHLPKNEKYQLLVHPITLKQYLALPHVYPTFFTKDLNIISPIYSSKIDLINGESYGLVLIRTSNQNIELSGTLEDTTGNKIQGGNLVYLDKEDQTLWRCQFAPPKPGKYNVFIYANTINNEEQVFSSIAVQFALDIDQLRSPSISYPLTWSEFFNYNLEIIKPKNSRFINWSSNNNTFYGEVLIRSPDNVYVSAIVKDTSKNIDVKNGTLVNYNHEENIWQCLFAAVNTNVPLDLTLFAKYSDEDKSHGVTQFDLQPISNDSLTQCMTFPETYIVFTDIKCHLIEPLNGILQKDSIVHFRCQIPGAREVNMTVDGNWIKSGALKPDENNIFDGYIQVGRKEVAVWVKFNDENNSYKGLLKYTVR